MQQALRQSASSSGQDDGYATREVTEALHFWWDAVESDLHKEIVQADQDRWVAAALAAHAEAETAALGAVRGTPLRY